MFGAKYRAYKGKGINMYPLYISWTQRIPAKRLLHVHQTTHRHIQTDCNLNILKTKRNLLYT
jgi:hypothetical protein